MRHKMLAQAIVIFHAAIVGITVAGGIAIFTGRFSRFHRHDYFAWAFIACCVGQLGSLLLTGGCILTQWEKQARGIGRGDTYAATFIQQYLPFLPEWFNDKVPLLTLAAIIGAAVQIGFAVKRRRASSG